MGSNLPKPRGPMAGRLFERIRRASRKPAYSHIITDQSDQANAKTDQSDADEYVTARSQLDLDSINEPKTETYELMEEPAGEIMAMDPGQLVAEPGMPEPGMEPRLPPPLTPDLVSIDLDELSMDEADQQQQQQTADPQHPGMEPDPAAPENGEPVLRRNYFCPMCPQIFMGYGQFYMHVWDSHPGTYECVTCGDEFDQIRSTNTTLCMADWRFEWLICENCKQNYGNLAKLNELTGYFPGVQSVYLNRLPDYPARMY